MDPRRIRKPALIVAFAAGLVLLIGCKENVKTFVVRGKIHDKGQPIKLSKQGRIAMSLEAGQGLQGTTYNAEVNPETGEFKVPGKEGKGIPAGQYKISIMVMDGIGPPTPGGGMDKLGGKLSGKNALLKSITDETELDIDVSKPK